MQPPRLESNDPALRRLVDQVLTARDMKSALDIRGGGTKAFYGGCRVGEPLEMRQLAGISSHEPTELVVTARAGTPLAELEAALAEHGQCLPFEPPRFAGDDANANADANADLTADVNADASAGADEAARGTVGGMVAAGLAGPARLSAGALRDYVLGVTMLNGRGELLTFGGQVMKNVAGYDVSRLLAGSLGVLGVICEVSLKVLPRPAEQATLEFAVDQSQAMAWFDERRRLPLPINASSWHDGRLRVRLQGAAAAVRSAGAKLGGSALDPAEAAAWWEAVRDQRHPFFRLAGSAEAAPGECLWRLSLPATAATTALPEDGGSASSFIEWGGAQRWWRGCAPAEQVRAAAAQAGGHATLFRGGDKSSGAFAPLSPALMRIHRALKTAFDPQGVFNRGRLYPDL